RNRRSKARNPKGAQAKPKKRSNESGACADESYTSDRLASKAGIALWDRMPPVGGRAGTGVRVGIGGASTRAVVVVELGHGAAGRTCRRRGAGMGRGVGGLLVV